MKLRNAQRAKLISDFLDVQRKGAGGLASDTGTDNKTLEWFYGMVTAKREALEEDDHQALRMDLHLTSNSNLQGCDQLTLISVIAKVLPMQDLGLDSPSVLAYLHHLCIQFCLPHTKRQETSSFEIILRIGPTAWPK
jgi:hypothetical protein